MAKNIQFQKDAIKSLSKGVRILAKAVKTTLGPKGKNMMIKKGIDILSTKDGVTVAKEVFLKDKFENMGAELLKQAAYKTEELAKDGTTTSIVLTEKMYLEGVKAITFGSNILEIKSGMKKALKKVLKTLDSLAEKVDEKKVLQIAKIAANNDSEIGNIVFKAIKKTGLDGIVTVANGKGIETVFEAVEGLQFDSGYLSTYFINNPDTMSVDFEEAYLFLTDKKLVSIKEFLPIFERIVKENKTPIVIMAEDISEEVLQTLVLNRTKASLSICALKIPGFGMQKKDLIEDIALISGAKIVLEDMGINIKDVQTDVLGKIKNVRIEKDKNTIIGSLKDKEKIKTRILKIKKR